MASNDALPGTRTTDLLPPLPDLYDELVRRADGHPGLEMADLVPEPQDAPVLRWGIIGAGGIAGKFATDVPNLSSGVVCAVGSRSKDRAQAFIDAHPGTAKGGAARAYGSYEGLLADPEVEAVYVASPHSFHHRHALAALEAGKHVLVEKSFTQSAAQAREVLAAAADRGLFAMEAMWTRFLPHDVVLRALADSGALGELRYVRAEHYQSILHVERMVRPELAGGALLDLGVYSVSLVHALLGRPGRVTATGRLTDLGVDLEDAISLEYDAARAVAVTGMDCVGCNTAEVLGTRARAQVGRADEPGCWFYTPSVLTLASSEHGSQEQTAARWDARVPGGFQFEAAEVARCVAAGRTQSPTLPWETTLAVMEIMDEMRAQVGVVYPDER